MIRRISLPLVRVALVASFVFAPACRDTTKPKPAVDLQIAAGNAQNAEVNTVLPINPAVRVVDEDGHPVSGALVNWGVSAGGTLGSITSTSDAEGIASPGPWKLSEIAGTNHVLVGVANLEKTITFVATGIPGAPASLSLQAGADQTAASGDAVAVPPSVKLVDAYGNVVGGKPVTFAVTAGGGSLTGAATTTGGNGIATVGSWTLAAQGINSITATVVGPSPLTINAIATPAATQLALTTQPGGAISGESFTTQPVVVVRDASSALVATSTAAVTAAIASGTGTLSGVTTVNAVNGVATFTNLAITGTTPVTLRFSATGLTAATSMSFTPQPPPSLNLTIDNVHLTQATQTYAGTVPLVAGRAALARVFVKANITNSARPSVRLRTYRSGVLFREYTIAAPTTFTTTTVDETVLQWSWNYLIPANEVVTGMTILADVDPSNAILESSDTDNTFPASGAPAALDVRQVSTMKVTFIPVSQPTSVAGNITAANKDAWLDYPRRVYPFDTVDVIISAPYAYGSTLNPNSYDATWTNLLTQIKAKRAAEAPGSQDRYYYAVTHANTAGGTGWGSVGFPTAIGMDYTGPVSPNTNYYSMTLAHEWGHNFGRGHVGGCGAGSPLDTGYPYNVNSSVGTTGYDLVYGQLYNATSYAEFMSYCKPLWVSDYTYKAVLDYRAASFAPPSAELHRSLLIWGHIGPSGVVLEPAYEVDAPVQAPTPGPYTVQALDDAGRQIFAVSFAGIPIAHSADQSTFAFTVPLPAGSPEAASLRVLGGTRELARRARSLRIASGGATTNATSGGRLLGTTNGRARLEWDARTYPGAMVRDPATGEVLAFLRGGAGEIAVARDVDVLFSNGVSSVKQRVTITPR